MGQWENLPADLLNEIEKRLVLFIDKVRFTCVCKSWKSALPKMPPTKFPWLLLPCNNSNGQSISYGLLNVSDEKTYYNDLPVAERVMFRGSSHGWVVSVEDNHDEIYLMNPFTRVKIQLPSRSKFPDVKEYSADNKDDEYTLRNLKGHRYTLGSRRVRNGLTDKFFISGDPSSSDHDYTVVVIYGMGSRLAYCNLGDEKWTSLDVDGSPYQDITFNDGKLYALSHNGLLQAVEMHPHDDDHHPRVEDIAPRYDLSCSELYLVESSNEFLLVERQVNSNLCSPCKTVNFNIFKLDSKNSQWSRITDIGDDVLFIGFNTSVSRSALEFPGLKRNSIYFTDNLYIYHDEGIRGGSDIGVFDLDTKSIEPLPGYKCDSNLVWPPPIWIIPTP